MLRFLFVGAIILIVTTSYSQDIKSPIIISKNRHGKDIYMYNDKIVYYREIKEIVKDNDSALFEINKGRSIRKASSFIGFTGSFLSGIFMWGTLRGNIVSVIPFSFGCVFMGISIPLANQSLKHTKKSVEIYNRSR